jgi:hypothetical protein
MIEAQDEYLYLSEEESSEAITATANTFRSMQLSDVPPRDCLENPRTLVDHLTQPCNVTTKRNTLNIARGKVVGATAIGVGAMVAGAAAIATLPTLAAAGGITLAAAWTGWNITMAGAFTGALWNIVSEGLSSITAKWDLEDCKRSIV